ncbi:MAG: hypothetical protein EPN88_14500 [Bacteroidetes bacterium]|nr:MAG: hypothetical protein EPN88_14500 [Bacteroidota bacterium]
MVFQGSTPVNKRDYLSPETVIADGNDKFIYVALKETKRVTIVDVQTNKVVREINISQRPTGLVLSPTQPKLYVTGGMENGKVYEIDLGTGKVSWEIAIGYGPSNPAVSPDGKVLYVPTRFDNNVSVVDLAKHKVIQHIPVRREPVTAILTNNGSLLFIGHLLPDGASDMENVAASISVINTSNYKVINTIKMPNGSTEIHGMVISPDGQYLYISHLVGNYTLPTNQLERGWMNTNVFTIIDIKSQKIIANILLDDLDKGAANPWGVAVSNNGALLVVAHAGTNEISIIERKELHKKLDSIARGEQVTAASTKLEDISSDFSFLVGLRQRIQLKGIGPRCLAIAGGEIFVAEYFSGSLGIIDLNDLRHVQSKPLGEEQEMSVERRGEMIFNDATKCFQSWQSCISCHPDARSDGLNWDLMNDGIGHPKNTKSLLLSHKTPPAMALGIRANAEVAVRSGFKYILFSPIAEYDAVSVDEYLRSIRPLPSPHLIKGELNKSARRGEILFEKVGCINCHSGPYFTNMKSYDVGTLRDWDKSMKKPSLDVPSLIEVWRTAPYLHDGRAVTVQEAFSACHPEGVKGMSENEMSDLVEYVLSL